MNIEREIDNVLNYIEWDSDGKESFYRTKEVEKAIRIALLKGATEYTIWADYVPNGNEICDKYQEELKNLTK